jgi:hypothetical protein
MTIGPAAIIVTTGLLGRMVVLPRPATMLLTSPWT